MSTSAPVFTFDTAFLNALGLKSVNPGVSTGTNWQEGDGDLLHSYSPADGKLIGSVKSATREN